ncbi:NifB/NifX family molybdenum-iron cluster-binding protein [Desulfobulbus sp.]|uniref:NifB/NifX family molybdenum-iron cluster-binding protein n=1 Tax=Desulfobulbus sp. TaxID=895 RepID=UPI00286F042D|nr:NifB/NifX family molybdenum-iron cluster-binding protein [Desulfobulbus sp.]
MEARDRKRKIAVTVWEHRVSPVFDAAQTLLIAEIDGCGLGAVVHRSFDPQRPLELLRLLHAQEVEVIICGAVSEEPAAMLEAAGIKLIPFVTGRVDRVLAHYLRGRPFEGEFCMPGCGRCCRKGRRTGSGPSGSCERPVATESGARCRSASGSGREAQAAKDESGGHPAHRPRA